MVIGVCGYGFTGSGALFSLLKEYELIRCLPGGHEDTEFSLSYFPDGIEDLEYHLCINPAKGTGSDSALYRFELLVKDFERSHNRYTNNRFKEISFRYIDSLSQVSWAAYRSFEYDRQRGVASKEIKRIKIILGNLLKKHKVDTTFFPIRKRYISINPADFIQKSKDYLSEIIGTNLDSTPLLLNQPFSSTNPLNGMKFFNDSYCIIVDRDPRDLYIMTKYIYGKTAMFIPVDSVENYVKYYKIIRSTYKNISSNKVKLIKFEDLIYKYDDTNRDIQEFLHFKLGRHINKRKYFIPEKSKLNTCVYKAYTKEQDNIRYIEKELAEYLYPFDENKANTDTENLTDFSFL